MFAATRPGAYKEELSAIKKYVGDIRDEMKNAFAGFSSVTDKANRFLDILLKDKGNSEERH